MSLEVNMTVLEVSLLMSLQKKTDHMNLKEQGISGKQIGTRYKVQSLMFLMKMKVFVQYMKNA